MRSSTWRVLRNYPGLRWYLITCICKDMGDWLVRVSNLIVVQEWSGTGTALSFLVLSSLLPKALLAPLGGLLADRYDRRHLMIFFDALAGIIVLGFLVAVYYKSLPILFFVTAARSAIAAIYYPVTYGLMPLMVPDPHDMQYTGTLLTSVYGLMSVLGGLVAGGAAVALGLTACYAIDTGTYFLSSLVMLLFVSGNYKRQYHEEKKDTQDSSDDENEKENAAPAEEDTKRCCSRCQRCCASFYDFLLDILCCFQRKTFQYLAASGTFMLIFLKPTDSLIWGPGDIVGVEIATVRNADGSEDEASTGYRMGLYYCMSGFGVFVGPMLANFVSDAEKPKSLQLSCCFAIFVAMTGWVMAAAAPSFNYFLLASFFGALDYGTLWAYSSLLLQLLVDPGMLGRVLSLEFFWFVMAESFSSSITGPLFDIGFSTRELCLFGAFLAFLVLIFWSTFHACGRGAAHPRFNQVVASKKSAGGTPREEKEEDEERFEDEHDQPTGDELSLSRRKGGPAAGSLERVRLPGEAV